MKHKIKLEPYVREEDGEIFIEASLEELAGAGIFSIRALGSNNREALRQVAIRLDLVSRDAADISEKIFKMVEDESSEETDNDELSEKEKNDGTHLRLCRSED